MTLTASEATTTIYQENGGTNNNNAPQPIISNNNFLFTQTTSNTYFNTQHIESIPEENSWSESKISITPELHVTNTLFTESQFLSSGSKNESETISLTSQIALRTGILFDERLLAHENVFSEHPERPARISVIRQALKDQGLLDRVKQIIARPATDSEILLAHDEDYISWLSSTTSILIDF